MPHIFAPLIKNARDRRPQAARKPISGSMVGAAGPLTLEIDLTTEGRQDAPSVAYRHALGSPCYGDASGRGGTLSPGLVGRSSDAYPIRPTSHCARALSAATYGMGAWVSR